MNASLTSHCATSVPIAPTPSAVTLASVIKVLWGVAVGVKTWTNAHKSELSNAHQMNDVTIIRVALCVCVRRLCQCRDRTRNWSEISWSGS